MSTLKDWIMEHKIYVIAAVLLVIGGYYFYNNNSVTPASTQPAGMVEQLQNNEEKTNEEEEEKFESKQEPEVIMVDIKGQVKMPGVYKADEGERIIDLISRAGGLTELADQTQVNFAEHVVDAMVIYIPAKGEEGSATGSTGGPSVAAAGGTSQSQGKINLNKADETELQNLPGIGPAKAAAIIEYRSSSGPFKAVEDLKNVSGIGDKTFEKLKDLIVVK
jgi:competence protein ComEA